MSKMTKLALLERLRQHDASGNMINQSSQKLQHPEKNHLVRAFDVHINDYTRALSTIFDDKKYHDTLLQCRAFEHIDAVCVLSLVSELDTARDAAFERIMKSPSMAAAAPLSTSNIMPDDPQLISKLLFDILVEPYARMYANSHIARYRE